MPIPKVYIRNRVTPRERLDELIDRWNKFEQEAITPKTLNQMRSVWNEMTYLSRTFDLPTGPLKEYFI